MDSHKSNSVTIKFQQYTNINTSPRINNSKMSLCTNRQLPKFRRTALLSKSLDALVLDCLIQHMKARYHYSRTNDMHFLYSVYYELTASTCFEHYMLIFRRCCTNYNWYIACVFCLSAATRFELELTAYELQTW
jgi:hypothetical protein